MARRVAAFLVAFGAAGGIFVLFPAIDLWASGLFYRPGEGFFLSAWPPVRAIYRGVPLIVDATVILVPAMFLAGLLRRRPLLGVDRRVAAFLLLSLAIGPGLVVNTLFKDHWGRARPTQVVEFGGTQRFTPAFVPALECTRNCSFPAGHPAMGYYLVSLAFLVRDPRRRRIAQAGAIACGALFGVARLAQGGHFLSDVVASGFLVYGTSWLLYRWIVVHDGLATLVRQVREKPAPALRLALFTLGTGLAILFSFAFLDRPLARYFHDSGPTLQAVFRFITEFGKSAGYLATCAVLFLGFRIAAALARNEALARQHAINAWRATFVFAAVALPGLVGDLLKPVFGRARPKLLFADGIYGFTWSGARADHWSFPSGHTITMVALASALAMLWPRGLPLYVLAALLVAASRVIITAHYLSDVMAGAFLAIVATWALRAAFARAGIPLAAASPATQAKAQ